MNRPKQTQPDDGADDVNIELSGAEYHALLAFKYVDPTQLARLKAAKPVRHGEHLRVKMEAYLAEMLVGDLSYVINRSKPTRTIMLLNDVAEAIESALR